MVRPKARKPLAKRKSAPKVLAVREVAAAEFKDKCLELLDGVRDHRYEVIVTKHGKPTARIVAPDGASGSIWGILRGTVISDEGIMDPEPDEWRDYL